VTPYELKVREPETTATEGVTVVELVGEIDLSNAADVERRLAELGEDGSGLVLDLNRVTFLDSAALHMLFRVARRFQEEGRFGIVLEPTAIVATTLAIAGLDDVADVAASVDALVAERRR
jgi:anti-sigma B factor antagonist